MSLSLKQELMKQFSENEETVDEHKTSVHQAISFREDGFLVIASLDVDLFLN